MPDKRRTQAPTAKPARTVKEEATMLVSEASREEPASFNEVTAIARERAAETSAERAAREKREQLAQGAAAGATPQTIIDSLSKTRLAVNEALDRIGGALLDQAKQLTSLEEAVRLRRSELEEVYRIEVAARTLEELVARYHTEQERLERERAEARASAEVERRQWRQAFEEEQAETRKAWERAEEEYDYRKRTEREREEAEYQTKRKALFAEQEEERARREQELKIREEALAAREVRLAELEARVQAFPAELEQAVARAQEAAVAAERERTRVSSELAAKEAQAAEALLKQRVAALEEQNRAQNLRIGQLERELREAVDRVRDIALKAIEGASGAAALQRVSELALHQARQPRGEGG
ncbi:MAG TPA: hypothetical protein VEP50_18370 [bacterium]|nr:hypothetical protein [bacterium]